MRAAVTQWFADDVKPVHVGVYQRWFPQMDRTYFAYWSGSRWSLIAMSPAVAFALKNAASSSSQMAKWRGLADKP